MERTIERAINRMELKAVCYEMCDKLNATCIYDTLLRNRIESIDDLRSRDLDTLAKIRQFGEMRLEYLKEIKLIIEDEEKIRNILEKDADVSKLRNDACKLYEQVNKLYYDEGKSPAYIARTLGISDEVVYLLK